MIINDPTKVPGLAKQVPGAAQLMPGRITARQGYAMIERPPNHATVSPVLITPLINTQHIGARPQSGPSTTTRETTPSGRPGEVLSTQQAIEYDLQQPQRGSSQVDYAAPYYTSHIPGYNVPQGSTTVNVNTPTPNTQPPQSNEGWDQLMTSQQALDLP